jgi:hypothetical protein
MELPRGLHICLGLREYRRMLPFSQESFEYIRLDVFADAYIALKNHCVIVHTGLTTSGN